MADKGLIYMVKSKGPRTEPWGTPECTGAKSEQWLHKWKWKCVNFKCYSSEELITLNTLHEVVPTWYSFHSWVDWSNADKVSCSRRKHIDAGDWTVVVVVVVVDPTPPTCCQQSPAPEIMWQPAVSPPRWQGKAPLCRDSSRGPG